ncbi:hypothetical protein [Streptomyces sp. DSM 41634]|uniref:hypothetical protein n=1 Tax=Streptomyces sp. DSM 41634 TaxID=3448656 RepID=UPI0040402560
MSTGNTAATGEEFGEGRLYAFPDDTKAGGFGLVTRQEVEAAHEEALELEEWYWDAVEEFHAEWENRLEGLREDPCDEFDKEVAWELVDGGFLKLPTISCPKGLGTCDIEEIGGGLTHSEVMRALATRQERTHGVSSVDAGPASLALGEFDGGERHLFYRGRLNYLFGKAGAGKTNLLIKVATECVRRREFVVWLNFEDMPASDIRQQMVFQGVPEALVRTHFLVYDKPENAPAVRAMVSLVIIDAVNPCIGFMGKNPMVDPTAMDEMRARYFTPFTARNPDVTGIAIDHVGQGREAQERPSGHHRKMDLFQGAAYRLAPNRDGYEGDWGYSTLYLAKDNKRKTRIRVGERAGYMIMDSSGDSGQLNIRLVTEEPTGTSHTPEREKAKAVEGNSTRAIAERLLAQAGDDGLSRKDWGDAIFTELIAVKPDGTRHRGDIADNISKLRKAGVVGETADGNFIHLPTVNPLD